MATIEEQNLIRGKIEDLQQNEKFLLSNYDYYHKNNEFIILEEEMKKLRQAGKKFSRMIAKSKKLRKSIDEGQKMCNEFDEFLKEMQILNEEETDENGQHHQTN